MKFIMPDDPNSVEPAIPPELEMLCELLERNGVAQWIVDKACILLEVAIEKYSARPTSSPPTESGWILTAMNLIQETFPLALEYETDARDVWPERWKRLKRQVDCQMQPPQQGPIKED